MEEFANGFLAFSDASPTPFHCCKSAAAILEQNGFVKILENKPWGPILVRGGKYYFTRNGSSLCAFVVGEKYKTGNPFKILGAHTDSPVLKVKPVSKREANGCDLVGVETYGGGLWHTWFDRDLGVAGRVIIRQPDGSHLQQLIHIQDPLLRVANLCIHLQSSSERAAFSPNKETELLPILSSLSEELNVPTNNLDPRHSPKLLVAVANAAGCAPEDIVDFELSRDTQEATLGGAAEEFIFAPRLDNQLHCYVGTRALAEVARQNDQNEEGVLMLGLFDHEEVGSDSNEGAGSPLMRDCIQRVLAAFFEREAPTRPEDDESIPDELFKIGLAKSILFSADMAHAVHPNYPQKHESNHSPVMGKGTVIKTNVSQRYATNAVTGFFVRELARQNKSLFPDAATIPVQEFVVRNDMASGSTIGPILAHGVGIRTVDVGIPQLSMHSIREQCAVKDLWSAFFLFRAFFREANKIDQSLSSADEM